MTEQEMFNLLDLVMKQQNLLNLLKEKRVEIRFVEECINRIPNRTIEGITIDYNADIEFWGLNKKYKLTEKEMQLIVDWLKEE